MDERESTIYDNSYRFILPIFWEQTTQFNHFIFPYFSHQRTSNACLFKNASTSSACSNSLFSSKSFTNVFTLASKLLLERNRFSICPNNVNLPTFSAFFRNESSNTLPINPPFLPYSNCVYRKYTFHTTSPPCTSTLYIICFRFGSSLKLSPARIIVQLT